MPEIFVSIACYRDRDVLNTVRNLIVTAARPDALRIVVLVQDDPAAWGAYEALKPYPQVEVHYRDLMWAEGPAKARAELSHIYHNETWFMQLDSHMRFEMHWDQRLVAEYAACGTDTAILTTLPPNFMLDTDARQERQVVELRYHRSYQGIPLHIGYAWPEADYPRPERPAACGFVAAGVLFGPGRMFADCPIDPYTYYHSEEFNLAIRLWTHGYTLFCPRFCFCYHAYRDQQGHQAPRIEATARDGFLHERGLQRLQVLLGMKSRHQVMPAALVDIEAYGLGQRRTVTDWEKQFNLFLSPSA